MMTSSILVSSELSAIEQEMQVEGQSPSGARSVPQGPAVFHVPVSGENQLVPGLDSGAHVINRAALGRLEFSPQLCTTRIWVLCF